MDRAALWHRRTPRSAASSGARGRSRNASASTCTAALEHEVARPPQVQQTAATLYLTAVRQPCRRRPERLDGGGDEQHGHDAVHEHDAVARGLDERLRPRRVGLAPATRARSAAPRRPTARSPSARTTRASRRTNRTSTTDRAPSDSRRPPRQTRRCRRERTGCRCPRRDRRRNIGRQRRCCCGCSSRTSSSRSPPSRSAPDRIVRLANTSPRTRRPSPS